MLLYNPGVRHTAGVSDYDWSKWESGAFALTEDLKAKASAIADQFKSQADADAYMASSSDPLQLKLVVQYAVTAKKQPAFESQYTSSATKTSPEDDAVDALLPPGGRKVLEAPESVPPQKSQKAADLLASLMTPAVLKAIPAQALVSYLTMLDPLLAMDMGKKAQGLESFLARLRVWPVLNQIHWLASNELDPVVDGKHVLLEQVAALVAQAKAMLPPDTALTEDQPRKQLDAIVEQVKAIKAAEVALMKAQLGKQFGFKLSETNIDYNTQQTYWVGPVAVNPRVAKKTVTTKDGKQVVTLDYPIPDVYLSPWQGGIAGPSTGSPVVPYPQYTSKTNPSYVANLPALADYVAYDGYEYNGMNKSTKLGWDSKPYTPWKAGTTAGNDPPFGNLQYQEPLIATYATKNDQGYAKAVDLISAGVEGRFADQERRLWGRAHAPWLLYDGEPPASQSLASIPKDKFKPVEYVYPLGAMISYGLWLDPEWGGGYFDATLTPHKVADSILPVLKQAHDKFRAEIMAPGGPWDALLKARAILVGTIAKVAFLPPVDVRWAAGKPLATSGLGAGVKVLEPVVDKQCWDEWRAKVLNPETAAYKNLMSMLKQQNQQAWNGKYQLDKLYPEFIGNLADAASPVPQTAFGKWIPGKSSKLPYPLVYPPANQMAVAYGPSEIAAKAAVLKLSADQVAIVNVRAESKASTLLAMKASALAASSQALTSQMIETLTELAERLYGCAVAAPPAGTKPQDYPKHYEDQLKACAAAPKPDSLVGKLAALTAQYADLKAKSDKGDKEATSQLAALTVQIADLKEEMSRLVNRRVSRRKRATDNTVEPGGTIDLISKSGLSLDRASKTVEIKVGDTKIELPPSGDQGAAAGSVKAKNDETKSKAQDDMGYVIGSGEALKKVVQDNGLPVSTQTLGDIESNTSVAKTVIPQEEKSGSLWWLLLIAAIAAAKK